MAAVLDHILASHALSAELADIVSRVQRSVVLIRDTRHSAGSGVVWDADGTIVTNHHVVPEPIAEVTLPTGERVAARVTRRSESLDLAALRLDRTADAEPVAVRDSAELRAGELVLAIGNPMGERNVATLGLLVAAPDPPDGALRAAISLRPGNSGGALADAEGRIVGIPNLVMRGRLAQAVSTRAVARFLSDRKHAKPRLGVAGQWVALPAALQSQLGSALSTGLLVAEVLPETLAARGGLLLGDLVLGVSDSTRSSNLTPLSEWADATDARALCTIRAGRLRWIELETA